jgi:hypothetical protein
VSACCTSSWRGVVGGGDGILAATRRRAEPRTEARPVRRAAAAETTAMGVYTARSSKRRRR